MVYMVSNGSILFEKEYRLREDAEKMLESFPQERIEGHLRVLEVKTIK